MEEEREKLNNKSSACEAAYDLNEVKTANRKAKDSVFTDLFSDVKNLRRLYEALHDDGKDLSDEDFKIITLENVFVNGVYNDLGVIIKDRLIILVEAQSTLNPNMAMRFLIYLANTYQNYILENDMNIYGSVGLRFPRPEFVLVYTGKDIDAEKKILNLSELYDSSGDIPLELKIRVISGKDKKDTILREYIEFCRKYDEYRKGCKSRAEILAALKNAIHYCISNNILAEYLKNREMEVADIMIKLFTDEQIQTMMLRDEYRKGREEGREEGFGLGEDNAFRSMVKSMKSKGRTVEEIVDFTGLPREKVESNYNLA